MNERRQEDTERGAAQAEALASPIRLEILGLFAGAERLAVSEMAARMGRPATSIYHHVHVLLEADILREDGTRPKGKRYETLYAPVEDMVTVAVDRENPIALDHVIKAVKSGLRMAERDVIAAVMRDDLCFEGPERNLITFRAHVRASKELLAKINEHFDAIQSLLFDAAAAPPEESPDDQFLSLTTVIAPLSGRETPTDAKDGS